MWTAVGEHGVEVTAMGPRHSLEAAILTMPIEDPVHMTLIIAAFTNTVTNGWTDGSAWGG